MSGLSGPERPAVEMTQAPAFSSGDFERIVVASDRAFGLLVWLGGLVDSGGMRFADVRAVLASPRGAADFVERHSANLPSALTPPDQETARLTANVLGTYLAVSFDLEALPGERRTPDPRCAAGCPWCWQVSKGPHLGVKTLTTKDKLRAAEASMRAVRDLLQQASHGFDDEAVTDRVAKPLVVKYQEEAAIIAYASALADRATRGVADSSSLALWRLFAWSNGSPRKSFRLDLPLVERARLAILRDAG